MKQTAIASTAAPAIVALKNVGKLRPCHLICAVALTIDGQLCTPDRYRPRIACRKAHRKVPVGLIGIGGAVAAGDEDRHMLYLRELLQAAIEGADVVGGYICFVYAPAGADHAARISVGCIIIEDMLQFIIHLRPGIVIGIAISLVD